MTRREELRLRDILQAISAIRGHIAGGTFDDKTSDAVLYNLVVIGEAAVQISEETRDTASEIPWSRVIGLRNLIAHEYFRVDLEIVETIIAEQLDQLEQTIQRLIEDAAERPS